MQAGAATTEDKCEAVLQPHVPFRACWCVGSWLSQVKLGVICQLGSLGWQATDLSSVLLHGGLHFYSHVLHQSDVVVLCVLEDWSEVCCYWSFCYLY